MFFTYSTLPPRCKSSQYTFLSIFTKCMSLSNHVFPNLVNSFFKKHMMVTLSPCVPIIGVNKKTNTKKKRTRSDEYITGFTVTDGFIITSGRGSTVNATDWHCWYEWSDTWHVNFPESKMSACSITKIEDLYSAFSDFFIFVQMFLK